MKRRRSNRIIDKNKKLTRTKFEDLSNELIYEIFDYFDYFFLYEIFANLNLRFQSLFLNSSLPIKINFSLTSKSIFQYRCQYLIPSNIKRIISLNISKDFLYFFSINLFSSLQSLTIHQIQSEQISSIINQLISLSHFSSLSISSSNYFQDENSIYLSIFRLTKLTFCKLTFPSSGERVPLTISTAHYSSLESLILNGHCRLDQLISILSYTPKLRHLSCQYLYGSGSIEIELPLNLTSISFILYRISFDELKLFLSKISFRLKKLRIKKFQDENFFHAEQWEQLITNSMPDLHVFDLQYSCLIDHDSYQILINRFSSNFWIERNWFFDYYYYETDGIDHLNFFSIVPYRCHQFILYEQIDDHKPKFYGQNFARHLTIEGCLRMDKYSIQFPRVTKLTIKHNNIEENPSFINNVNSILPLKQIMDFDIKDNRFSIDQLIEILRLLPNLQSLTLSNISSLQSKPIATNYLDNSRITKVIIDEDECELKHVQFLIHLFPYLQYLEIGIDENQWKEILRFLLIKSTYLFSLFLLNINSKLIEKIQNLITHENLLNNYTIEHIHGGLYLWW